jgi:hypothetical protein
MLDIAHRNDVVHSRSSAQFALDCGTASLYLRCIMSMLCLTLAFAFVSISPEPTEPEPTRESLAARPKAPSLGALPTPAHVDRINRMWRGVGVGFDLGLWGRAHLAQSLKIDIPFGWRVGQFFGVRVRETMAYTDTTAGLDTVDDPVLNSGVELFGRGPVLLGVLRVYGGGGAWVGVRLTPTDVGRSWSIGGGGHFGVEFALAPRASLQFEFGGQAPGHALGYDAGASVMAGVMIYTGKAR